MKRWEKAADRNDRKREHTDRISDSSARVSVLKDYECFCYRVAFYLLMEEAEAIVASRKALAELLRDDTFFEETEAVRRHKVKRAATIHALSVKRGVLQQRAGFAG
ncbi:hypothetical protein [Paenibacillus sp. MBLB4367]|uniref:hypothetical protein n=1 Tax=Paenibacillus sp. MBLB4367 TaxID=3384767 RepID=UPI0039083511